MAITYVGAGALTTGTFSTAITPPLPSGIVAGDLLCCFSYHRTTGGTNSVSSGWSTLDTVDTGAHYHKLYYRVATGSDTAPTITPSGALSGQPHLGVVLAYRDVSGVTPFGTPGTASANASAEDIGPITAATASSTGGAVIVFGARNAGSAGGTTALLSGDGLTWVEAVDGESSIGNYVSPFVIQHAIWTGSPPTLTAKTFDVSGGSAGAGLGRMYLLNPTTASDVSFVGIGEHRTADFSWYMEPTLPTERQTGDLLFLTAYMSHPGTMAITSGGTGWVEHLTSSASERLIKTWYRWVDGAETIPHIANTGTATPRTLSDACIVAYRGVDPSQPFGTHGADSFNASASSVGPISAPSSLPTKGAILLFGARNAAQWSSVAAVTGDGVTWVEDFDNTGITVDPYAISTYMSHATWTSGTPTITAKTLVPTGGAAGLGSGKMFVLRAAGEPGVTERTINASADVAVAETRSLTASADVVVEVPLGAVWSGTYVSASAAASESIWSSTTGVVDGTGQTELGTIFSTTIAGVITGVRVYGASAEAGNHNVRIWNNDTNTLISGPHVVNYSGTGWKTFTLPVALDIQSTTLYTVAISTGTDAGFAYSYISGALVSGGSNGSYINYPANAGVYTETMGSRPTSTFNSNNYLRDIIFAPTISLNPPLPVSLTNGDLLFTIGYLRNAGTLSISSGWTQHSVVDTVQNGSSFYLQTWYRWVDGTETAPTITINGGSTSPQTLTLAVVLAARDVSEISPFFGDGDDSFNALAANVGPAAVPTTLPTDGAVIVVGIRNSTPWTGVSTLSGDGLTWVELFDNAMLTAGGLGTAMVADYAAWTGGAPSLTTKTFTVTGGSTGPGMSKMFVLSYTDVVIASVSAFADVVVAETRAVTASADVYVQTQALSNTVVAAADVYVVAAQSRSVTALADVVVATTIGVRSVVAFADCVVEAAIVSPDAPRSATAELSAENVDTAWLVLLTIDHPDLDGESIRVTSDGVPTMSGGLVYSPFPFMVILPDDVEGRPPQAQLQIDNTTQEIVAILRGLVTPPTLSIMIVRSSTPDMVEYAWYGLEWTASSYDKSMITGTLTMPDLTTEEFPFETFSGQWPGLFA